jgi:hypothetical protein
VILTFEEVYKLVQAGDDTKEIARDLGIPPTVLVRALRQRYGSKARLRSIINGLLTDCDLPPLG